MLKGHRGSSRREPLRVVVLCSRRAPGLADLLDAQERGAYQVRGVITSDPGSSALPDTAGRDVPCVVHDIAEFYRREDTRLTDLTLRAFYDVLTAQYLVRLGAELVILTGYVHILTSPVLNAFPQRVISIHDSDLMLSGPDGLPRYRGLRSTRDAILAGDEETRSTLHFVTPEVDLGPPLLRSRAFPVAPLAAAAREWRAHDMLKAYAYAHREWMMRSAWGPMLAEAASLIAAGSVTVSGLGVRVGGEIGPLTLDTPEGQEAGPRAAVPEPRP